MAHKVWFDKGVRHIVYLFSSVIFLGLMIDSVASGDIWADEACTLATCKNNYAGITYATAIDVHPPLYYYITKIFYDLFRVGATDIEEQILLGRVVSLIPLFLIFVVSFIAGMRGNRQIYLLYPFLLLQYYPVVHFSCEIRMYSWALLFVVIVAASALRIEEKGGGRREWVILVVSSVCVCYTHYFAVISVLIIWAMMWMTHICQIRFLKKELMAGIAVGIGYAPWLLSFFSQIQSVHDDYWISDTDLARIKEVIRYNFSPERSVRYFFYFIFLLTVLYSIRIFNIKKRYAVWMNVYTLMPFLLIMISVGISKIYRPILIDRYIVPTLGVVALGELLLLNRVFSEKSYLMKIIAVFFCIMAIGLSIVNVVKCYREERNYSRDWDQMIADISSYDSDIFLYIEGGHPLVRPLTVMFPEARHVCDKANMTEYNQFLFGTIGYDGQDMMGPAIVIVSSEYQMGPTEKVDHLGTYATVNGVYSVYYTENGVIADVKRDQVYQ